MPVPEPMTPIVTSSRRLLPLVFLVVAMLPHDALAQFTDVTSGALGDNGNGFGVAWGDYDNGGDLDLYVTNDGPNLLLRNEGAGSFTDVAQAPLDNPGNGGAAPWGDYDNDDDLDLYLVNYLGANCLLRNQGGGTFVDATGGLLGDAGAGQGAAWADYDNDDHLDLYLVNYGAANKLLRNQGNGTFADATGAPVGDTGYGVACAWGDYDNDGDLDVYVTNDGNNKLFRNQGGGVFVDATTGWLGDSGPGQVAAWGDYDNDGDLDVYVTNDGNNKLFWNQGGGVFVDATTGWLGDSGPGQVAWGDGDGDLDLYLANDGQANKLFRNDLANGNHWLQLDLTGTVSNRSAIGARVKLVAGGVTRIQEVSGGSGYLSQNSLTVEFGLGASTTADSLVLRWPSGVVQKYVGVIANRHLAFLEQSGTFLGVGDPDDPMGPSRLLPPAPNPFRERTRLRFALSSARRVRLAVLDVQGRRVARLLDGAQATGAHAVTWDGCDDRGRRLSAGVYLVRLEAGGEVCQGKAVLAP